MSTAASSSSSGGSSVNTYSGAFTASSRVVPMMASCVRISFSKEAWGKVGRPTSSQHLPPPLAGANAGPRAPGPFKVYGLRFRFKSMLRGAGQPANEVCIGVSPSCKDRRMA
eukprot:6390451-Pyramimonas_sp.AAC.1